MRRLQHSPEYRKAVGKLVHMIEERATPKRVDGMEASGGMLSELVDKWAQSINVPIGNFAGGPTANL